MALVITDPIHETLPLTAPELATDEESDTLAAASGIINALLIGIALWAMVLVPVAFYYLLS